MARGRTYHIQGSSRGQRGSVFAFFCGIYLYALTFVRGLSDLPQKNKREGANGILRRGHNAHTHTGMQRRVCWAYLTEINNRSEARGTLFEGPSKNGTSAHGQPRPFAAPAQVP